MRVILALLLVFAGQVVAHSIDIEVSMPMDTLSKVELLEKAKVKAVHQAADKLPTVIWGSEQSVDSNYHEEIKAIGFAHATVEVINENFDVAANTYALKADVYFDRETIMNTLDTVKDGVRAKRAVDKIVKLLDGVRLEDFMSNKMLDAQLAAKLLTDPSYLAEDILGQLNWNKKLLLKLQTVVDSRVASYIQGMNITLKGIKAMRLEYQVTAAPFHSVLPAFEDEGLNAFVTEHKDILLKNNEVCFAFTTNDIDRIPTLSPSKPVSFTFTTAASEDMIKANILPIVFYLCRA